MVHFDCDIIGAALDGSCINLGLDGTRTTQQLPMLELYMARSAAPKLLVLEVDVGSLEVQHRALHPELAIAYANVPAFYEEQVKLDPTFWAVRHVPLYGFASIDLNAAWDAVSWLAGVAPPATQRRQGYAPVDLPFDSTFADFKHEHPDGVVTPIEPLGERAVDRLIELGQRAGAKVVLVYPPMLDEAHHYLTNEHLVTADLERIAAARDVPFIDYSTDEMGRDASLYYNSQHLNVRGATRFSKDVSARLLQLARSAPERP